jgi:hypothetical protein
MAFQVYKDQSQFYQTVTKVQEGDEILDLVTLPPGTLLFRAAHIPNTEEGDDVRRFYRDYLGGPEDKDCPVCGKNLTIIVKGLV